MFEHGFLKAKRRGHWSRAMENVYDETTGDISQS